MDEESTWSGSGATAVAAGSGIFYSEIDRLDQMN
jgi:hypothetical protein